MPATFEGEERGKVGGHDNCTLECYSMQSEQLFIAAEAIFCPWIQACRPYSSSVFHASTGTSALCKSNPTNESNIWIQQLTSMDENSLKLFMIKLALLFFLATYIYIYIYIYILTWEYGLGQA